MPINRKIYSFNEIVNTITTTIGATSLNLTDFNAGSNLLSVVESFSHFIEFLQTQVNVAFEAFSVKGASGVDLNNRVQDFNIFRKTAVKSYGVITFSRTTPAAEVFEIPQGSQVSTEPDVFGNTIDYITTGAIVFSSGAMSATGVVECTVAGIVGNQPSGTITNITSIISGIDTVTNPSAFTPGADEETDEQLRSRVPSSINGLKKGNVSSIKSAALAVPGIVVVRIDEGVPSAGQITVYISNQSGVLTDTQIAQVQTAIDETVAFGVVANVATPSVSYITLSMTVTYDSVNYLQSQLDTQIKSALYTFVSINPNTTLQIADLIIQIMSIPGVKNVRNVLISDSASDFTVDGFGAIRLADEQTSTTITYVQG
jgi:uncharacterized phage protein gp47/JayE